METKKMKRIEGPYVLMSDVETRLRILRRKNPGKHVIARKFNAPKKARRVVSEEPGVVWHIYMGDRGMDNQRAESIRLIGTVAARIEKKVSLPPIMSDFRSLARLSRAASFDPETITEIKRKHRELVEALQDLETYVELALDEVDAEEAADVEMSDEVDEGDESRFWPQGNWSK